MCAAGSRRASAVSMRACRPTIQAWKSGSTAVTAAFTRVDRTEGLQDLAFQDLHLLLSDLELLLAEARELEAALVRGERLLERELAAFHPGHDFFQLGERLLEGQ